LADIHALRIWATANAAERDKLRAALEVAQCVNADLERERAELRASPSRRLVAWIEGLLESIGLSPERRRAQTEAAAEILASGLFDEVWYLAQYPQARAFRGGPVLHFLTEGWRAQCNPSPRFDTAFYIAGNADMVRDKINPLLHFIRIGKAENRLPAPRAVSDMRHSPHTLRRICALGERSAAAEHIAPRFAAPLKPVEDRVDIAAFCYNDPEAITAWFAAPLLGHRLILADDGSNLAARGLIDREIEADRELVVLRWPYPRGPVVAANFAVAACTSRTVAIAPTLAHIAARLEATRAARRGASADFVLVLPSADATGAPDIDGFIDVKSKLLLTQLAQAVLLVDRVAFSDIGGFNDAADLDYPSAVAEMLSRAVLAEKSVLVFT
jgi:hypothetical protein